MRPSRASSTTIAHEPRSCAVAICTASTRSGSTSRARSTRCPITSESTSDRNTCPCRSSVVRRVAAFSTVPLCTTLIRPEQSACGCAFSSRTDPQVAQRVCPIPTPVAASSGVPTVARAARSARRSATRETDRTVAIRPAAVRSATPTESWPRYSIRSSPSSRKGVTSSLTRAAMMPHIRCPFRWGTGPVPGNGTDRRRVCRGSGAVDGPCPPADRVGRRRWVGGSGTGRSGIADGPSREGLGGRCTTSLVPRHRRDKRPARLLRFTA